jgi:hypothetical protein
MGTDTATQSERECELERVLREVGRVIDAMTYGQPVQLGGEAVGDQPNPPECFGPFEDVYDGEVIVWPDLRWAKDQIVKALAT